MSLWQRQCVVCRRTHRPLVYCRRMAPFGTIGLCAYCQRNLLSALLERSDPPSLSELLALLRYEDAERREDREDRTDGTDGTDRTDRTDQADRMEE